MYCLAKESLKCKVWFRKFVCFFKKRHHAAKTTWSFVPRDPSTIFLATTFTRKMPESSNSMYSSFFMPENVWYHQFTWSGPNSQEIVSFSSFMGPRGPELNWNKFIISCEYGTLQVKWRYHMFSSIKIEEYMESEFSGIFWVKLVTKNIVLGFSGTHFMHMRVKDTQVDQQVAKKCPSLKVTNYSLRCNSETSLRRPERSQRRLCGDVFNTSHRRRLRDFQISPLWDVSETLHETSQRCIWDASIPAGWWIFAKSYKKTNYAIQNNNKLAI